MAKLTRDRIRRAANLMIVARHTRQLHGPRRLKLKPNDVVVVCLVKNGEYFVSRFIEHHLALGVHHFVFIDNGSTDKTLQVASAYGEHVTMLRCPLPASKYETDMRHYGIRRFARGQWCLLADIDELFDYPFSDFVPLPRLTTYLDSHRFNAVVAQMLDMLPSSPTLSSPSGADDDYDQAYTAFDVTDVRKVDYFSPEIPFSYYLRNNHIPDERIKFYFDGVRYKLFGTRNCLTKHALIRTTDGLEPVLHPHCSGSANCADFSAVLRHYKLAGDFAERISAEVESKSWSHGEDAAILRRIKTDRPFQIRNLAVSQFKNSRQLLSSGFLVASDGFLRWAETQVAQP